MAYLFKNNAVATFASAITNSQTSIQLSTGQGAKFPTLTGGNVFYATFSDAATNSILEVVLVTAIAGDVLTVTRAQDGTTAQSYLQGDNCSLRLNAGVITDFLSKTFGGALAAPLTGTTLTMSGLIYGNGGGGNGLGNIFVQSGGAPSGGANGDLFLIY